MLENWRPIVGFEGLYAVSDMGNVKSLRSGELLALCPHTGGYLMVHLYVSGTRTPMTLHRAVAEAFLGPRPAGKQIRHVDGNRKNCSLANLAYGTKLENEADKLRHGTRLRGEQMRQAKLTEADVRQIRARRGERQEDLADEFGCTFSNISAIQRGVSWRHV